MTKILGLGCAALISTCLALANATDVELGSLLVDPFSPHLLDDQEKVNELVTGLKSGAQACKDYDSNWRIWEIAAEALHRVMGYYPAEPWGKHSLEYGNPEIKDAIVEWVLSEYAARKHGTPAHPAWQLKGESGEFFDSLVTCAQATLSPRIYEYQLVLQPNAPSGEWRVEYLARVNPERTLNSILTAAHGSGPVNPEYLVKMPEGVLEGVLMYYIDVKRAFDILSKMCERAPDLIMRDKERIRTFIQANVYFYRGRERKEAVDCEVRLRALDLYALWADPAHIAEIEQLAVDVAVDHEIPFKRRIAEQVVEKVNRILTTKFERQ